jgi:hypothetical protein
METINLYFDMEFTSLSPDAQPISLGIISDCGKSIYCEFTDFDINRCDDWVKENVVGKLRYPVNNGCLGIIYDGNRTNIHAETRYIRDILFEWLKQFSSYNIQFICDCGTFDWYHLLKLIGEWEEVRTNETYDRESDGKVCDYYRKTGLPKLPSNISPVPQDLNDLIAFKRGISVREAFDFNRALLITVWDSFDKGLLSQNNHNSLYDAKVIKAIYENLMLQ